MTVKTIRSISALVLASLVMLSSTSFMVGVHFCMGEVKSVSFFSKADQCLKKTADLPMCHKHMKSNCCQDKAFVHEGDDFKNNMQSFGFESPATFVAVVPTVLISEIIPSSPFASSFFPFYDPPFPPDDLTVDLQVFII
jgi:hypothetical protein